jgi:hypothetical protein
MKPAYQKPAEAARHGDNKYCINPITIKRGRWLFWGAMAVFAVATALISLWVMSHDTMPKMLSLQDQLEKAKPYFLAWRIALMSVLLGFYPVWVNKVADWLHFEPWQRQFALSQRWHMAALVILVEILLPQHGLATFLRWLFQQ